LYEGQGGSYGQGGYGQGQKIVALKLTKGSCPGYKYEDDGSYASGDYKQPAKSGYDDKKYRVMIQFDKDIVSFEDVNFVTTCDQYKDHQREVFFQYTVIDNGPITLVVSNFV
jgi:hypothetical protein